MRRGRGWTVRRAFFWACPGAIYVGMEVVRVRTPNRTTFLSRRLNHRGTEGTEAEVAPFLRALCASVVLLFGTRNLGKRPPKNCCSLIIHRFPRAFVRCSKANLWKFALPVSNSAIQPESFAAVFSAGDAFHPGGAGKVPGDGLMDAEGE